MIKDNVKYTTELLEDQRTFDAKSDLSFIATREHHNSMLTCTASNPALNQPLNTQVVFKLILLYLNKLFFI